MIYDTQKMIQLSDLQQLVQHFRTIGEDQKNLKAHMKTNL